MTPLLLGVIVSLAAGTIVCLAVSALSSVTWVVWRDRIESLPPAPRARVLAMLRLLPASGAVMAIALTFNAFIRLESGEEREIAGVVLGGLALMAAMAGTAAGARVYAAWRGTMRTVAEWRHEAIASGRLPMSSIETSFPVVAVIGLWKPRLYIARQVMESCDSRELEAMVAHEVAHVRAADNVMRFLFLSAPAARFGTGVMADIEHAWTAAAEERADDCARIDAQSSLALASALTKVARLAANTHVPVLHASSIFSGIAVEARVRRLFAQRPEPTTARIWPALTVAAAVVSIAVSPTGQQAVYETAEFCIRQLP